MKGDNLTMSDLELNEIRNKLSAISKCAKEDKSYEFRSLAPYLNVECKSR